MTVAPSLNRPGRRPRTRPPKAPYPPPVYPSVQMPAPVYPSVQMPAYPAAFVPVYPQPRVQVQRVDRNGVGTAGLVLGMVAVGFSIIPVIGLIAWGIWPFRARPRLGRAPARRPRRGHEPDLRHCRARALGHGRADLPGVGTRPARLLHELRRHPLAPRADPPARAPPQRSCSIRRRGGMTAVSPQPVRCCGCSNGNAARTSGAGSDTRRRSSGLTALIRRSTHSPRSGHSGDLGQATSGWQLCDAGHCCHNWAITNQIAPTTKPSVFNSNDDAKVALTNGQVDALVVDLPDRVLHHLGRAAERQDRRPAAGRRAARPSSSAPCWTRAARSPRCVSQAVDKLRSAGTLAALEKQWLSTAGSAPELT